MGWSDTTVCVNFSTKKVFEGVRSPKRTICQKTENGFRKIIKYIFVKRFTITPGTTPEKFHLTSINTSFLNPL